MIQQQQQIQGPPGAQTGPARDRPTAQTGTAVLRGRVFAGDSGRPLRRAKISISAQELGPDGRTTSTNPDGRYEIKDLPAGRYNVTVTRNGYLQLRYGQKRPLEQGKPLQIVDRQVVDNIDFTLPRMSLITGRVYDETNEPISGVTVMAMRSMFFEGKRKLVPSSGMVQTDDAGQYRLLGLVPGKYAVMAFVRETWTVTDNGVEQTMGYAPTFFPGTASAGDAAQITVGIGQEVSNTDLSLIPGRAANISGTAFDSRHQPLAGRNVGLGQEFRGPGNMSMFGTSGAPINADGTFTIKNVPPGEYKLSVTAATPGRTQTATTPEAASQTVVLNGVDITDVSLTTSAGWSVSGVVVSDGGQPPDIAPNRITVAAQPTQPENSNRSVVGLGPDNGRVRDDWTFNLSNVLGPSLIRPRLPEGWILKSVMQGDRDVTDTPLEMKSGEEMAGVQIVVTNHPSVVSGQMNDDKGPTTDGTVIVFSADSTKWTESSRFVRTARPDQQGQYQIKGLPAGDYLAVAVDYVQEGMWNDPEYLESIRRYGQKLTLADGGSQAVALKIVTP